MSAIGEDIGVLQQMKIRFAICFGTPCTNPCLAFTSFTVVIIQAELGVRAAVIVWETQGWTQVSHNHILFRQFVSLFVLY